MKVNDSPIFHFTIFQSDGVTPWSGQGGSVSDTLRLNGSSSAQPVTINEDGSTGHYWATFTANAQGIWDLELSNPDSRVLGFSIEIENNDLDSLGDRLPATLNGGRMRSHVEALDTDVIDAASIAADAIGSSELATSAVNEIRDSILSDSTPFDGADIAAILTDTDEIQGKLPTNNIMGSSVKTDKDDEIDAILADTAVIEPLVTTNLDAQVSSRSSHSEGDVDTQLSGTHGVGSWQTATGFATPTDVSNAVTTLLAQHLITQNAIAALNDIDIIDVQTALDNQGLTTVRAALLDNLSDLDDSISNVLAAIAALNNISQADVQAAMTTQGYTTVRAVLLDNLDDSITNVLAAIAALNNVSIADVQTALTNQGYTSVRAVLLDNLSNLDAAISDIPTAVDTLLSTVHGSGTWESAQVSTLSDT